MQAAEKSSAPAWSRTIERDLEPNEHVVPRCPVIATEDNGTILPEAATFGDDREDALLRAIDAIQTAAQGRIAAREPFPARRRALPAQIPTVA
jgi:hypothetical protein